MSLALTHVFALSYCYCPDCLFLTSILNSSYSLFFYLFVQCQAQRASFLNEASRCYCNINNKCTDLFLLFFFLPSTSCVRFSFNPPPVLLLSSLFFLLFELQLCLKAPLLGALMCWGFHKSSKEIVSAPEECTIMVKWQHSAGWWNNWLGKEKCCCLYSCQVTFLTGSFADSYFLLCALSQASPHTWDSCPSLCQRAIRSPCKVLGVLP